MLEKICIAVLLFALLILGDWHNFKRLDRKSTILYVLCLLPSIYLSLLFSTLVSGPGFEDVLNTLYGGPAKRIVNYLDVSR
jgi:hypothetical protein